LRTSLASFDVLALSGAVGDSTNGLTEGEIHALAYLACLMGIYDGNSPNWWSYTFSVTETGAPFAREVSSSIGALIGAGWLVQDARVHRLSLAGKEELEFEITLAPNRRRRRYLRAAASAALSIPLPSISDALTHEPGLRRALAYMRRKQLLDETSLSLVADQFDALTEALGQLPQDRADLMVPAVVWLTYLSRLEHPAERAA
jgi:hypothetical protein